jgi:predicted ArsR family transcriptional regulator
MQTYQMAMLLLFETCDTMTCKEIQDTLQLNNETFQKHMQSLIEAKLLVAATEVSYAHIEEVCNGLNQHCFAFFLSLIVEFRR